MAIGNLNSTSIDSLTIGQTCEEVLIVTKDWVQKFIELTGDYAPVHHSKDHAILMGYQDPIVHGLLIVSVFSRILGMFLPGPNTVIHQITNQMKAPVFIGDKLIYSVTVSRIISSVKTVQLALKVTNQNGVLINNGEVTCLFRV